MSNESAKARIRAKLGKVTELLGSIESDLNSIDAPKNEQPELTSDEVVEIYGLTPRLLAYYRGKGLPYVKSKPAKYSRKDVEKFLYSQGYKRTENGWSKQSKA